MTFAELKDLVLIETKDYSVDTIEFLRKAENDFIKRTNCTEDFQNYDTNDLNSGTLSDLYDLPTGFVREYRIEWDGIPLDDAHKNHISRIYNASNVIRTGKPYAYFIENEQLRLIPKPTSHSYLNIWYCIKNTDGSSASPIIPSIEQEKIINYAIYRIMRLNKEFKQALFFKDEYEKDVRETYAKYTAQRFNQNRIVDGTGERDHISLQNRIPTVSED